MALLGWSSKEPTFFCATPDCGLYMFFRGLKCSPVHFQIPFGWFTSSCQHLRTSSAPIEHRPVCSTYIVLGSSKSGTSLVEDSTNLFRGKRGHVEWDPSAWVWKCSLHKLLKIPLVFTANITSFFLLGKLCWLLHDYLFLPCSFQLPLLG